MGDIPSQFYPWLFALVIWSLVWKSWALWVAARKSQKIWYGVMFVLNTAGILEILYLFIFSKRTKTESGV